MKWITWVVFCILLVGCSESVEDVDHGIDLIKEEEKYYTYNEVVVEEVWNQLIELEKFQEHTPIIGEYEYGLSIYYPEDHGYSYMIHFEESADRFIYKATDALEKDVTYTVDGEVIRGSILIEQVIEENKSDITVTHRAYDMDTIYTYDMIYDEVNNIFIANNEHSSIVPEELQQLLLSHYVEFTSQCLDQDTVQQTLRIILETLEETSLK